jgi:hypothetical protein
VNWEPAGENPGARVGENELYRQAAAEIGEWDPTKGTQMDHIERIAKRARELMGGRGEEGR